MYDAILKKHKPRGWRIYHSKRRTEKALEAKLSDEKGTQRARLIDCAYADFEKKIIRVPVVVCEYTLQIVLHEFAHVHLKHITYVGEDPSKNPLHVQEFEADRQSMEWMRMAGVPVTRAIKNSHKRYLRHCIGKDEAQAVSIRPHIKRKARKK